MQTNDVNSTQYKQIMSKCLERIKKEANYKKEKDIKDEIEKEIGILNNRIL